ncbi:unnamed protein product, partial [Closterium sp. Naga37s-1]
WGRPKDPRTYVPLIDAILKAGEWCSQAIRDEEGDEEGAMRALREAAAIPYPTVSHRTCPPHLVPSRRRGGSHEGPAGSSRPTVPPTYPTVLILSHFFLAGDEEGAMRALREAAGPPYPQRIPPYLSFPTSSWQATRRVP